MRKINDILLTMIFVSLLSSCGKEIPEPELKTNLQSGHFLQATTIPVFTTNKHVDFTVYHHVKGKDVLVECVANGVSFRGDNQTDKEQGKIIVYINGNKTKEIQSAIFILKDMPSGKHEIKLELVKLNNETYDITKQFVVEIQ